MSDETEKPLTRAELEAWAEGVVSEIRGGGSREGGGRSPTPSAPSDSAPPGAEDESPVLREAREIEAARAREAKEVRLGRIYLEEKGGLPEDVAGALTAEEVLVLVREGALGPDADADSASANVREAARLPGESPLMSDEERRERLAAQELTVDPALLAWRKERGLA